MNVVLILKTLSTHVVMIRCQLLTCFVKFLVTFRWHRITLQFTFHSTFIDFILCWPLVCKSALHSTSQSVIISLRSVLPVNQPDSQPGSSITHLLCPRRRLPPDPHDAAVIPATPSLSLSLSCSLFIPLCCPSFLAPPTHPALPLNEAYCAACCPGRSVVLCDPLRSA